MIAIIGAGFSGLTTAYDIVRGCEAPVEISIFDRSHQNNCGIAYSTDCPLHLLNVPAGKMGALPENPGHFLEWLLENPEKWRSLHPSFKELKLEEGAFLPRMIYAVYLRYIKDQIIKLAIQKNVTLKWIEEVVVDAEREGEGFLLHTADGGTYFASQLILAVSTPWTQPIPFTTSPYYLSAPWPIFTEMQTTRSLLEKLPPDATIGIIGSGLTMLDVVAALHYCGFAGKIVVITGKPLLPQPHRFAAPTSPLNIDVGKWPSDLNRLTKIVRRLCKEGEWRCVIDALRPYTQQLWQRLSLHDKRRFLRRLIIFWNIHRHRAPLEVLMIVQSLCREGKLEVKQAFVKEVVPKVDRGAFVNVVQDGQANSIAFDLVVNCTGPNFNIGKSTNPLVRNLLKRGVIEPDELGMGAVVKPGNLYALGSLTFGTYFEITAVPEIRRQGAATARSILEKIRSGGVCEY